jgi:serine/threonine-protein kinase
VTRRRRFPCTIPDHASRRIDEAQLDAYRVIAELARGGTSTVYLGEERATGERVAIKALDAFYLEHGEMVRRLLREHELASRARHPCLVASRFAAQTCDGVPYLVMEYLDGESLSALASRGALAIPAILGIAVQLARGLAALHAAGVVHCDVKPDNVYVLRSDGGGTPHVKLIDFGVARALSDPPPGDGEIAGTPAFMAPEQWRGAPVAKSDVYALGCLLYELITGRSVFTGSLPQLMVAHCEWLPERPSAWRPEIGADLERLIIRMLAKDPAMRPSMAEIHPELMRRLPVTDHALEAVG